MKVWQEPVEFDWDRGNIGKNLKHNVADKEAEEIFNNRQELIFEDEKHSSKEESQNNLGKRYA